MSLVYRAVPDDDAHRTAYRRLLQYSFTPEQGPAFDDDPRERPAEFEPRGLYDRPVGAAADTAEGKETTTGRPPEADVGPEALVVGGALVDFRMRIRGEWRPVGGVSAIASPPEHRRHGHVETLLDRLHAELRDRDAGVAALWPFSHPFYARFGYGRANDYVVHECPPEALNAPAATPATDGAVRRLSADDIDALSAVHEAASPEPLAVDRSTDWWRLRIFQSWSDERYVYGWVDDAGALWSYLAYRIEESDGDDGRTLVVDYWGAADDEGYRHLLRFLRNHDSQVSTVRLTASDASLLDRLSDPGEADTKRHPGPMVRVVDAERALAGLVTPATDERVVLRVRDERHDWNDGVFVVTAEDGRTTCRPVDAEATGESVGEAVTVDAGALSRLVVGARSASALADLGGIEGDPQSVERLDALLPEERPAPYLREFF